ncbi:MAG: ATP-binding cassette domain-containing protein [Clostridia bacterium]
MENNNEILLKVEHLCQYFKMGPGFELKAVNDISFNIKKGEVFGLVGESGCGKTTTGRSIMKLYDATSGNVYFKGERIVAGTRSYQNAIKTAKNDFKAFCKTSTDKLEIEKKRAETEKIVLAQRQLIKEARFDHLNCDKVYSRKLVDKLNDEYLPQIDAAQSDAEKAKLTTEYKEKVRLAKKERLINEIQMIFQDPIASLDPRMTVRDIISEGLIIKGVKDKKYINDQVNTALEQVGLVREHADRYPHEFSGGQRQRIGVARSIIMRPELIVADEPVSALDVSIQAQVINLLNDLRKELGLTIMFIAHDLSVVKYFSNRIAVMYYGNLVELTTSNELFLNPLHPYTRSLLSAIPLPDPIYEKTRKRIVYNPIADHDYTKEKPILREIKEGHFILCNTEEFERYKKELK